MDIIMAEGIQFQANPGIQTLNFGWVATIAVNSIVTLYKEVNY